MLLSERKWHEYLTHLLSSQLTGLLIPSVFTVYSSARDKINLFASFSIIQLYKNEVLGNITEQLMVKTAKKSKPYLAQSLSDKRKKIVRAYISELNNIISEYYISEPPWGLIKQVLWYCRQFCFSISLFPTPKRKKKIS